MSGKLYTFEPGLAFTLPDLVPKKVGGPTALKSIQYRVTRVSVDFAAAEA